MIYFFQRSTKVLYTRVTCSGQSGSINTA